MAKLSASDVAGLRVREARQQRGWSARELAERCAKAGAPQLTSTAITNLETGRRESRQVSVDKLLALAHALGVPPLRLLLPLGADEKLEVVPGTEMGALEAANWIAGRALPPGAQDIRSPHPEATGQTLRTTDPGDVLTLLRQADYLLHLIDFDDKAMVADPERLTAGKRLPLLADRLMHVASRLAALGYATAWTDRAGGALRRHGLPATLDEWRDQEEDRSYGEDGEE